MALVDVTEEFLDGPAGGKFRAEKHTIDGGA